MDGGRKYGLRGMHLWRRRLLEQFLLVHEEEGLGLQVVWDVILLYICA